MSQFLHLYVLSHLLRLLMLKVYTGSRSATYDLRNFSNLPAAQLKYDYNIVSTRYIIRKVIITYRPTND